MKLDILIRNGMVIDPASKTQKIANVGVKDGLCTGIYEQANVPESKQEIDATGCLVTPGLIDSHIHVFYGGTENGIVPDCTLIPMGVTTAVDQGSAGAGNFEVFYESVISKSKMHIFANLNISTQGLITSTYPENLEPQYVNVSAIDRLFHKYPNILQGIKVRISKELVGSLGMLPLEKALEVSEKLGVKISAHTTNPPVNIAELVKYFRKGDIYSHVFQQQGFNIIDKNGKIYTELLNARQKGVIFDAADGRVHYSLSNIKAALAQQFYPDLISTDLVQGSVFQIGVFGLPRLMSKYLALGMPIQEIIGAVTHRAAQAINKEKELGTLQAGACADIAIFELKPSSLYMTDRFGESINLEKIFVPQCTILEGEVVYRQCDF